MNWTTPRSSRVHVILQDDPGHTPLAALRTELKAAASGGRPLNIAAARHSMGAPAIPRNGHAITFDSGWIRPGLDSYVVHAGARWHQVIAVLDPLGLSPEVICLAAG